MKLNKVIIFLALYLALKINCQNSALSTYISANDWTRGDMLVRSVRVTVTTPTTYYCTLQFNAGAEMGGYTGIQDSPDLGNMFIFSLWNSRSTSNKIKASFIGSGTVVEPFGGEGEGTKSYNNKIRWSLNVWQTIVLRRWDCNNNTCVGWWIYNPEIGWVHLVTLDYPVANSFFSSATSSFLEDWTETGHKVRKFEMRDSFKRDAGSLKWIQLNQVNYSTNEGDKNGRSRNYKDAYDGGISERGYYMQTGGNTRNTCRFSGNNCSINSVTPAKPDFYPINFTIVSISTKGINWQVSNSSSPQFSYRVKYNGVTIKSEINSETRGINFTGLAVGTNVELTIEDILGQAITQSKIISSLDFLEE